MKKLTKREKEVLCELLKNGRAGDQQIARNLKTSRPTIFKIRNRLERNKIIKKYTTMVDFEKIGLNIQAVILYRWKDYSKTEELQKAILFMKALPEIILLIKGEGIGSKTDLIISAHENLKDYETFIRKLKYNWKDNVENVEVFLSSIGGISKGYDLESVARNIIINL